MWSSIKTASFVLICALAIIPLGARGQSDAGPRDGGLLAEALIPAESTAKNPDAGTTLGAATEPEEAALPRLPADRMPKLRLLVSPREGSVGDLITWKAEVNRRVGDRVHLSRSASFGDFEIQGKDDQVGDASDDWVKETLTVNLIAFETGILEIPSQTLTVVDIEGRVAELETEPVTVEIKSLIANEPEPQLKPDTGPGVKVFEEDYTLLYVLCAVGAVIVIALLTLLGRKLWSMRGPRPEPPPPPPRPAEEIALEKLSALKASTYLDEGQHKIFHVILSEAFREYLGNRYDFDSLERSTEELKGELAVRRLRPEIHEKVLVLLEDTDLVKFAKMIPSVTDSRSMLDEAFRVVDVTTPKPAPSATGGGRKAPTTANVDERRPTDDKEGGADA